MPDITHIVYVDPEEYSQLENSEDMLEVGRAVGKLNSLLPKRQFILMGPGRWGSRGDIKLGVPVTYSDFNNTAALIEIARKKGNYVPELSFGTHFFQDLVESSIRYLPLYPDDPGIEFNEKFLLTSQNLPARHPARIAPLWPIPSTSSTCPQCTGGKVLRILMNADLGEALGFLATPVSTSAADARTRGSPSETASEDHWQWRLRMAERMAAQLDGARFGVKALYVFGCTKNATAGPGSDIDLLIHFHGSEEQKQELVLWLEGWSLCLAEINFSRSGYKSNGLLDYPPGHRRGHRQKDQLRGEDRRGHRCRPAPAPAKPAEPCAIYSRRRIGPRRVLRIETHHRQFRPVVRRGKTIGGSDPFLPGTGQPGRFVNVAVQGDQRLPLLDEAADGDAAHVDVERERRRPCGRPAPPGPAGSGRAGNGKEKSPAPGGRPWRALPGLRGWSGTPFPPRRRRCCNAPLREGRSPDRRSGRHRNAPSPSAAKGVGGTQA